MNTNAPQVISYRQTSPGVYRITYDGVILGDSPGYTREEAKTEALRIVAKAKQEARDNGTFISSRIYQPGF